METLPKVYYHRAKIVITLEINRESHSHKSSQSEHTYTKTYTTHTIYFKNYSCELIDFFA